MANMQRHQSCSFPQQTQQHQQHHSRYPAAHNTSSAFSSSANPNEDWTKISDLAERRRIQNRIAQRNYRKKLKRRLEDLERKASSPSVSPEPSHAELVRPVSKERGKSSPDSKSRKASETSTSSLHEQQGSPEIFVFDELFSGANSQPIPQFTVSPQPTYSMPLLTPPTDYFPNTMHLESYPPNDFGLSDAGYQQDYMDSYPQTLPTMVGGALKQESFFGEEDFLSPFSMQYANLAGVEMSMSHSAASYGSRTPSPPASQSYSDSGENSPPNFVLPMTPISRSVSPNVQFIDPRWQ